MPYKWFTIRNRLYGYGDFVSIHSFRFQVLYLVKFERLVTSNNCFLIYQCTSVEKEERIEKPKREVVLQITLSWKYLKKCFHVRQRNESFQSSSWLFMKWSLKEGKCKATHFLSRQYSRQRATSIYILNSKRFFSSTPAGYKFANSYNII